MHPHVRYATPRGMSACEPSSPSLAERFRIELEHAIARVVASESTRSLAPKPRSRRCFVCGRTNFHELDFRACPRTAVLLRRSLAKFDEHGRLVCFDGSALPMTRHPGGVAAHLISRSNHPLRVFPHAPEPAPIPAPAPSSRDIPLPTRPSPINRVRCTDSTAPDPSVARFNFPVPTFHSSFPHHDLHIPPLRSAFMPPPAPLTLNDFLTPEGKILHCAEVFFKVVLLDSLTDVSFRHLLLNLVAIVGNLHAQHPFTLRDTLWPVFLSILRSPAR
ncbi:hypothetical protein R3P38DRAFT_3222936 [Favolaschia claudopus]|uniref:Uncharacterized protein n=1 Tax=Favolaschia claudopus TaxID=2862362 RepID=A0AAV9ZY62_9AGAR